MIQLFNLRLFRNNNLTILQPFIDKMKRGELTLENILDEDEIIQDLKNNKNSQFSSFFSNENIRKLIDYATKMPLSSEKNIGYKYPFNATELLCCDNIGIMERFMNEQKFDGGDSDEEEEEKDEGEKENTNEEGNEEKNEDNEKLENNEQDVSENPVENKKKEENSEKKIEKEKEGGEQEGRRTKKRRKRRKG